MANVITFPNLDLEMQLSEIEALIDAMIYMHEVAGDDDRKRVMDAETTMLFVIKDKAAVAQKQLGRITRRLERVA